MRQAWFRSSTWLTRLNTVAVGLALAASASSILCRILSDTASWTVAVPTFVLGTIWAWGLRTKVRVGRSRIPVGWLASMPLAAINAGCAATLAFGQELSPPGAFLGGVIFGSVVWIPSLLVTLVCFGLPIAWARKAAAKGLMGEERGEIAVGLSAIVMSVLGACLADDRVRMLVSLGGLATGGLATGLALARDRQRRRFLERVEAGTVAGFRVEATPEGRALCRVTATTGSGYRVAVFDEEIIPLEGPGHATPARGAAH